MRTIEPGRPIRRLMTSEEGSEGDLHATRARGRGRGGSVVCARACERGVASEKKKRCGREREGAHRTETTSPTLKPF